MTASLIVYVLYYIVTIIVEYRINWFESGKASLTCSYMFTSKTASLLLEIGVILTLSKWLSFLLRIQATINAERYQKSLTSGSKYQEDRSVATH